MCLCTQRLSDLGPLPSHPPLLPQQQGGGAVGLSPAVTLRSKNKAHDLTRGQKAIFLGLCHHPRPLLDPPPLMPFPGQEEGALRWSLGRWGGSAMLDRSSPGSELLNRLPWTRRRG